MFLIGYYKLKKLCETLNNFFLFWPLKIEFWKQLHKTLILYYVCEKLLVENHGRGDCSNLVETFGKWSMLSYFQ